MYRRLLPIVIFCCTFCARPALAQKVFEQLIKAGPADATALVDAYTRPLLEGFGLGMNSGWTNSAQTLGFMHFELRVTGTAVRVPTADRTFDVSQIGLSSNLRPASTSNLISPTFSGNKYSNGPVMDVFDGNNNKLISFELPSGVLEDVVPTPQIQFTLGLFANTDVTVRASPRVRIGKQIGSVSLIGFGVKHNFMRDLYPDKKAKVPFDLALAASYNRLNYKKGLSLLPIDGSAPTNSAQASDFSGQEIYADFDNYLFQAMISKQFSVFTPFFAMGYNISRANVGLRGNYPIIDGLNGDQVVYKTYSNPVDIERTYLRVFRADAGFQVKLPVIRIYASYGISGGYGIFNAGIGFGM